MKQQLGYRTLWTVMRWGFCGRASRGCVAFSALLVLFVFAVGSPPIFAAEIYMIDINDESTPATEPGWTGLDALHTGNGGSVVIDGVTFAPFSADGARLRGTVDIPNPNALTGDFVFDDGAGQAVGLLFGAAGDLQAGTWEVEIYTYDAGSSVGTQIVGYRTNGAETIISTNVETDPDSPAATFRFSSDGISAYDVFLRENSDSNRTRLNAVKLTWIPEPSTFGLLALGLASLLILHRQHRT